MYPLFYAKTGLVLKNLDSLYKILCSDLIREGISFPCLCVNGGLEVSLGRRQRLNVQLVVSLAGDRDCRVLEAH